MESITLSAQEDYLYREFEEFHKNKCNSSVELIITQTDIRIITEVVCKCCGEYIDITDYDCL